MSCCFSRRSSTDVVADINQAFRTVNEPFLKHSSGDTFSWKEDEKRGPTGDNFPTWVKDDETNACYACSSRFNMLIDRKHHCRRCRNIFCKSCSTDRSKILLFSIEEEVRVCRECFAELPAENSYITQCRPVLQKGENFKKFIMMGFSTKIVRLRLMQNETTLVYDDESRAEPTEIQLSDITKLQMTSLKAFEFHTENKSFCFEADSSNTQKVWIEALNQAIQRAKEPRLRDRVDNARRLKAEAARRDSVLRQQNDRKQESTNQRRDQASNIKYKYGLS